MNSLEMTATKISSAREILETAITALENHKLDKAEALMYATSEFLEYYLKEFDEKFKVAWKETVVAVKKEQSANDVIDFSDSDDTFINWENMYPEEYSDHFYSHFEDCIPSSEVK